MNHVRVTTISGAEVDIPHAEAERIAKMMKPVDAFHHNVKERNVQYHKNAMESIRDIAARYEIHNVSEKEEDLKELLGCISGNNDLADLIVEIIEERVSAHHMKIYSE